MVLQLYIYDQGDNTSFIPTEREGHTVEHWCEVVAAWTERSAVLTEKVEGQYSPA